MHAGKDAVIVNNRIYDRGVKELIQIADARRVMKRTYDDKFKESSEIVDLNARNQFHSVMRSVIKYMIG